jgi:predicted small integral membrane protein
MIETRIVKIVMIGSLSLFAGLVAFDNLTDYETNYVRSCRFIAAM